MMFHDLLWIASFVPTVNLFLTVLAFTNPDPGTDRPGLYLSHHVTMLLAFAGLDYLVLFGLLHWAGAVPYPLPGTVAVVTGLCAASAAMSRRALPQLRGKPPARIP